MMDDPSGANPREHRLQEVLAAYYEAAEHGSAPDRQILLDRHSELAGDLIEFFAIQDQVHHLAEPLRIKFPQPSNDPEGSGPTERDSAAARLAWAIAFLPIAAAGGGFGDYELLDLIARGAMGIVVRARQRSLNRLVALKVLRDGVGASVEDAHRFRNEAEVVAKLDHPHIVPIYEVGDSHGCRFFSMKLIEGGDLAERLGEFTSDPRATARLIASVARAVQHAHDRGILHRDLKPSNILIDDRGDPLVADFGLARRLEGDSELTRTGVMLGTPAYMSPEQASGRKGAVTIATDVHGLGAVLYTILAGRPPFRGDSPLETLERVREHAPDPPRTIRPSTDRDLETICLKCLEKDPNQRYASAAAVADDLDRWLAGRPILARPASRAERAWRLCRRHPRASALVAVAIVVMATSVVGLIMGTRARQTAARLDQEVRSQQQTLRRQQYVRDVKQASQFWAEDPSGEALKLLDRYRPAPPAEDMREYAWHYFHRLCTVGRPALTGHQGEVFSSAFSPDGKTLATASMDRTVRIWEPITGETRRILVGHTDEINWVSYSPDGRLLATASDDQTIRLWDASTGQLNSTLIGHRSKVVAAVFTRDGRSLVSGARGSGLFIWDVATSRLCDSYAVPNGDIQSLAISPDGAMLALGGDRTMVWSIADHREFARPEGQLGQVMCVVFSHDGKHLAATGGMGLLRVWDTRDWRLEQTFSGHRGGADSVAYSPDDRTLALVDAYGIIDIWDSRSGSKDTIASGQTRLWCVSFSPDGRTLATVSQDRTVKLWDIARDRAHVPITLTSSSVPSFAFSRDGKTLTVVDDRGSLQKFETREGHLIANQRFDTAGPIQRTALSQGATVLVTVGKSGLGTLWDLEGHRRLHDFPYATAPVRLLAIAPDGRWIAQAVEGNRTVLLWSSTAALQGPLDEMGLDRVVFSPAGDFLSIHRWGSLSPELWEVTTGKKRGAKVSGHRTPNDAEAFAPDGATLATGSGDGSIILWGVPDLDRRGQLPKQSAGVRSLAFSPDGRSLVAGYQDGLVRLWELDSGMELATLQGHSGPVLRACFSTDGVTLATCGEAGAGGYEIFLWPATPKK
jgi:eukaryotic-like serine/threonine-protein kinase